MAGGVRSLPAQQPLPVEASGRTGSLPRHSRKRRSPMPTATAARSRTRRDSSTSRSPARRSTCSCRSHLARTSSTGSDRPSSITARQQWFSTRDTGCRPMRRDSSRRPAARRRTVTLSFSELKYLFECPYQFKLRFLYGFNPPLHEALGYGKGLHDALAEVHKRALAGDLVGQDEADGSRRSAPAHAVRVPRAAASSCTTPPSSDRALLRRTRPGSGTDRPQREADPGPRRARHHRRRPHRPDPPARYRRARDRRLQVHRARAGRRRYAGPAPCLRRRLRGADRRTART